MDFFLSHFTSGHVFLFEVANGFLILHLFFLRVGMVGMVGMGKFATETGEYTDIGDHHGRRWRTFVVFSLLEGGGWARNVFGRYC